MNQPPQFVVVSTAFGDALLAANDVSHATPYAPQDVHPAFSGKDAPAGGTRVHFKAHGSQYLDLPGVTPKGLAHALNGDPF